MLRDGAVVALTGPDDLAVVADALAGRVRAERPVCGGVRLVGVDGRAGAGKSTLAAALAAELEGEVLALDDLVPGWHALSAGPALAELWLARPAAAGARHVRVPRWDWAAGRFGPDRPLDLASGAVVVDGVGATAPPLGPALTLRVWVETPEPLRRRRFHDRDEGAFDRWWPVWAAQEEALISQHDPAARAHVRVRWEGEA